jgi:hypothetical protein
MGTTAAMSAVIKLSLPVGLLVLYVVGVLIWYELLRSQLVDLLAWRRRRRKRRPRRGGGSGAGADATGRANWVEPASVVGRGKVAPVASDGDVWELVAVDGAAGDDSRMHYHLARKAAAAERDAAVEAANDATRRAVERIEQRHGQGSARQGRAGRAAKAERDAAVEAASAAAKQAIERIERRYREIDWALEDEEAERLGEALGPQER